MNRSLHSFYCTAPCTSFGSRPAVTTAAGVQLLLPAQHHQGAEKAVSIAVLTYRAGCDSADILILRQLNSEEVSLIISSPSAELIVQGEKNQKVCASAKGLLQKLSCFFHTLHMHFFL